ncbi:MAG: AtpZ/AtpI family protein [Candidatus Competibacteraceae bacterium]|jgi:ATP synthase protein I|nr:AtpZ/AtpI family protein [Candidatus Competibacteraceae bacterium]MCB1816115.1 AtpZ/AtpI family protein [Candidatus Competibacteraceae bacterium]
MKPETPPEKKPEKPGFSAQIERKVQRKLRAREHPGQNIYFWLGMFGMVGWSVAIPTLLSIVAGVWLDRHLPVDFSWTLTLLVLGIGLGCWNAWYWVQRAQRQRTGEQTDKHAEHER